MAKVNLDTDSWTYGCEHEFGDWDQTKGLPSEFGMDRDDVTIVNSNGIAADPKGKVYSYGGEINTPPTKSVIKQKDALGDIIKQHPNCVVNYRSNLHIHVRVPGLRDSLSHLKLLQEYITEQLPFVIGMVEPIPVPIKNEYKTYDEYQGAKRRYRRRMVSHQTFIPRKRVESQLTAKTTEEFFNREVPHSTTGKPLWHFQPRAAVNLRQLLDTDTIEFRHFPGTLDGKLLVNCIHWCKDFLRYALCGKNVKSLWDVYSYTTFPKFPPYIHWMECRYRATCHDGTLSKTQIKENIDKILAGEFDDQRVGCLSR